MSEASEINTQTLQATRDPFYLDVGERILNDLVYRARVPCGLAGISDLPSNGRSDRMESFSLSETLKVIFFVCVEFIHLILNTVPLLAV
jgi:hypothetical protein